MDSDKKIRRPANPRASANPLSALLFIWLWKIFKRGLHKEMEIEELFEPLEEHRSEYLGDSLERCWKAELSTKKCPSLLRAMARTFFWPLIIYNIPMAIVDLVFRIAQPLFLGQLLRYFEPGSNVSLENAYLNAFGILACNTVFVFVRQPSAFAMMHISMKIRVSTCSLIYRKALRLAQTTMRETTVGQVVNMLSNDVSRFDNYFSAVPYLLLGPVQTAIITYIVWDIMGVAAVFGILIVLIFIPMQVFIGKKITVSRLQCSLRTDERVRLMNEMIAGIQLIKLYAWETPLSKLVAGARLNEVRGIRLLSYLRAVMTSFEGTTIGLALFITILSYVLLGNIVTAEKIFVVTSFFNIVRLSMTAMFPKAIYAAAETLVSIRRIEKFLSNDEMQTPKLPCHQNSSWGDVTLGQTNCAFTSHTEEEKQAMSGSLYEPSITVKDATAKWAPESKENTLTDINLRVTSHQLLAVIGPVGSGKSSLLMVMLRELPLTSGSIVTTGTISYASQEPWLFASSVRSNILFGAPYDSKHYQQVVKVCALAKDFQQLPYGDRTVVGDRGISLSGGQKARINLARAVYKEADIYLLDDPLSAVDAHVGRHLFESCICEFLSNKICILVTHQLQFLSQVDDIIILNEGRIEAHGIYSHLHESGVDFAKLLEGEEDEDAYGDESVSGERCGVIRRSVSHSRRHRNMSVVSSTSSTEVTSMYKVSSKEVQEMRTRGKIASTTYSSYLLASRRYFLVVVMLLGEVIALSLSSGADYWLSFWTNTESQRALDERTNKSTTNGTAQDLSSNLTHTSIPEQDSLMSINSYIYVFTGLTVASIIFVLYVNFLFFFLCMESSVNLHDRMFNSVIRLPMRFFNVNPSGQILNRFSKDMGAIDDQLPPAIIDCLNMGGLLLSVMVLIIVVNYWVIIPTLLVIVAFYLCRVVYMHTSRSVKRMEGITCSPVFSHLTASLQGLATIRAFKAERILQKEFDAHQDLHSSAYYLFIATSRAFGFWLEVVILMYISCVTLSFLFLGRVTLSGHVGLAIAQSLKMTGILQYGMRQSAEMENQMTSVERVLEYSSLEDEGELKTPPEKKLPKEWPSQGSIIFKNVYLSYDVEEPQVLKNLNLTINPSEKVGIVGRTGAGKSSIVSALFRMTSIQGSILIDGVDTQSIGLNDLRSKISVIPQEPVLFSGSIRKNLDPFNEYSDAVLWNALKEVELKDLVTELPDGLNYRLLEGGSNFSVGQRQLVCLARVIIRNNKILVMDEATANIDPRTDALVQKTVRQKFAACTVLTIAHRLLTVMDSDRILVADAGNVVEFDHPHILLNKKSGFLWNMVQETGKSMAETLIRMAEKSYESKRKGKSS